MKDPKNRKQKSARIASAIGLVAAGVVGGAALAGTFSANAATSPSASSSSSSAAGSQGDSHRATFPAHGTAAHEALEKPVTGANATKAQAAAVKSVGSGTAGGVTTDATGTGYEVTVKKSDGSTVEVHLDGSFNVNDHGGPHDGPQG